MYSVIALTSQQLVLWRLNFCSNNGISRSKQEHVRFTSPYSPHSFYACCPCLSTCIQQCVSFMCLWECRMLVQNQLLIWCCLVGLNLCHSILLLLFLWFLWQQITWDIFCQVTRLSVKILLWFKAICQPKINIESLSTLRRKVGEAKQHCSIFPQQLQKMGTCFKTWKKKLKKNKIWKNKCPLWFRFETLYLHYI